jgi:CheY-like chemotaxis protein
VARRWILLVDDDPLQLQTLAEFISGPDIRVTTATDAIQAFIQARDLKPALIISDIQMPNFGNGDITLRELRKDERLRGIPFIFVTGMDLQRATSLLPAGDPTVRLLPKPIDWAVLEKWVFELAGLKIGPETSK